MSQRPANAMEISAIVLYMVVIGLIFAFAVLVSDYKDNRQLKIGIHITLILASLAGAVTLTVLGDRSNTPEETRPGSGPQDETRLL